MVFFFYDFIFQKSEIRIVLLEVGIDLGLLKKVLLKTSNIILMCSNSLARQFPSMFHAKCLLPRLDKLLHVRSCLQNLYQCIWKQMVLPSAFYISTTLIMISSFFHCLISRFPAKTPQPVLDTFFVTQRA